MSAVQFTAPTDPGAVSDIRRDIYGAAFLIRAAQGIAVGALFARSISADPAMSYLSTLLPATIVSGMALGTTIDYAVRSRWKPATALISSAALLLIAVVSLVTIHDAYGIVVSATLMGCAMGGECGTPGLLARQSLPNRSRWRGLLFYSSAFAFGLSIGVASSGLAMLAAAVVAAIVASFNAHIRPPLQLKRRMVFHGTGLPDGALYSSQENSSEDADEKAENCTDNADDCEETECCGGSTKQFTPMSFRQGVLISTVGYLTFFGVAVQLLNVALMFDRSWPAVFIMAGIAVGTILLNTTSTRTGYSVSVLLFLVVSLVIVPVVALIPITSMLFSILYFSAGVLCGGIGWGCWNIVAEQFGDSSGNPQLTRLVVIALFLSSALLLADVCAQQLNVWPRIIVLLNAAVFVVGILLVRSIPSPLISSLGHDDDSAEHDDELQDIMAAINS